MNGSTATDDQAKALRLPSRWHPDPRRLVAHHPDLIHQLVRGFTSPVHFVFPKVLTSNLQAFKDVLATYPISSQVLFAKKANKSRSLAKAAVEGGAGLDVASPEEFTEALRAGCPGAMIGVSGPAKGSELLDMALAHSAVIAVDELSELVNLVERAKALQTRGRILLRVLPEENPASRFGFDPKDLGELLDRCQAASSSLELKGFSFHLAGYSPLARCRQAIRSIDYCLLARQRGFNVDCINIGGGFAVDYVQAEDWITFLSALSPSAFHGGKTFPGGFYPYHPEVAGPAMLARILEGSPSNGNPSLAALLARNNIQLWLEPGRAILDQAGFTAFPIQGMKDRNDHGLITVDGMSFSLSETWFGSEFLPDPELLPQECSPESQPFHASVCGASCLESDLLTWRKVAFPQRPRPMDLLIYPNTAGYQMDSNESAFHERPIPPKVQILLGPDGPEWRLDRTLN